MLMFDNMWIPGGETPAGNLVLYIWEMMSSLGLGTWMLFMVGVVIMVIRQSGIIKAKVERVGWKSAGMEAVRSPDVVSCCGVLSWYTQLSYFLQTYMLYDTWWHLYLWHVFSPRLDSGS